MCPDDGSGGPDGSDRKHPRDDGDTAAAAADVQIWKNATWAVARAVYGDRQVADYFEPPWLTEDNFAGCTHWMLGSAMLSFKCLYTGADGANLYELKALRCVETGQGTAEKLLQHWQDMVFGGHHRKEAVIIVHALPKVEAYYGRRGFYRPGTLNAPNKLREAMQRETQDEGMISAAVKWKEDEGDGSHPVMIRSWKTLEKQQCV
jgi:hypothetical protein